MKLSVIAIPLLLSSSAWSQHPTAPSLRQGEQAVAQSEKDIPPPLNQRPALDLAKLKRDADELASLAQSVPLAVDQTTKGILPKDLSEKLKRIEKLAKQLRAQIVQ